jgi:hypothetical protein
VDHNTLICAYNYALILPHLHYCCEVWDTIGATRFDRLEKLQNRAARVITGRKNEHGQSELALDELKWKPLSERRTHGVASLMYKMTHELAPKRLTNIFQRTSSSYNYNMRGSSIKLFLPKPKTEYLKKVLVIEDQNCGTAFQMKQETNTLLPRLIHVYDTWPIN